MCDANQRVTFYVTLEDGTALKQCIAELKAELAKVTKERVLVGYVVKIGDEYATGEFSNRTPDKAKAYLFEPTSGHEWAGRDWAIKHRNASHPGGKVFARYRRVAGG